MIKRLIEITLGRLINNENDVGCKHHHHGVLGTCYIIESLSGKQDSTPTCGVEAELEQVCL